MTALFIMLRTAWQIESGWRTEGNEIIVFVDLNIDEKVTQSLSLVFSVYRVLQNTCGKVGIADLY